MNDTLTIQDAATMLKVCRQTIRRLIGSGALPAVRVNQRLIRIYRTDMDRFLIERSARRKGQPEAA